MESLPEVTLYVKAGADGKRYGACPFCQRIFMILIIKANQGKLSFRVATVNLAKPPDEFKKLSLRRLPAISHDDSALDNVDDIVDYLDQSFSTQDLAYENTEAEQACKDIFQKFCFFVKEVSKDASHLTAELSNFNNYLQDCPDSFLCSNVLCHLDCEVLPKLHHIRVAAKFLKGYEIPAQFKNVYQYLKRAYDQETFVKSCPSDQEVILHWADKPETPNLTAEQHSQLIKETQTYSTSIPQPTQCNTI